MLTDMNHYMFLLILAEIGEFEFIHSTVALEQI